MNRPEVSIIIPIYNREKIVQATLNSVLEQSYYNWECIVVDDGSTDETILVLKNYAKKDSRIHIYKRPKYFSKGANSCRNYGFTLAKGKYINWFDSDDIMHPDFLQIKLGEFTSSLDAVMHRNNYVNYKLTDYRESKFSYENNNLFYSYAMEHIEIQTCSFLWRYTYLYGKQLFDENIMRYQDNEFHIRILALKPKVKIINKVLASIRSGDNDKSQISSKKNISKKKLYDVFYYRFQCLKLAKNYQFDYNDTFYKSIAKKGLWAFYNGLSYEKKITNRIRDVFNYYSKLNLIYNLSQISIIDYAKSHLYIIKIIIFR